MPHRVLIADPYGAMRSKVRSLIEKSGWEVVAEAGNGQECIEQAQMHSPDLVILDLALPVKNAIEVATEVRKSHPSTKFLVFTVHDSEVVREEVLRAGMHGFAVKSSSAGKLLSEVRRLLDGG